MCLTARVCVWFQPKFPGYGRGRCPGVSSLFPLSHAWSYSVFQSQIQSRPQTRRECSLSKCGASCIFCQSPLLTVWLSHWETANGIKEFKGSSEEEFDKYNLRKKCNSLSSTQKMNIWFSLTPSCGQKNLCVPERREVPWW